MSDGKNRVSVGLAHLPVGWATASLGQLIASDGIFIDGDWVESKDQDPLGDVRLVQLADVGDGQYRNRSARFLTSEKAGELGCTYLNEGDILIARMPDPLGRACIFPGDAKAAVTVVDACIMRAGSSGVDHHWLMHTINSPAFRETIASLQSGTTRQRISRSNLALIEFPLPPLAEQHRIVAAIEQQFTRLDAGVAVLKQAQTALKRYRASVLKAAVEGQLTEQWRAEHPDTEPASQLLACILAERRARWETDLRATGKDPAKAHHDEPEALGMMSLPTLPEGWVWTTVEQLGDSTEQAVLTGPFGSNLGRDDFIAEGVPVLTIGCLTDEGLSLDKALFVSSEKASELERYMVKPGDVLFSRMASVGRAGMVPSSLESALINYHLMRLRLANWVIAPSFFIFYARGSSTVVDYLREVNHGATRDGINTGQLLGMPVALPPLAEQVQIVAEVEQRISVIGELEATIETQLKRANRLRQSILERAFAGQLVPQNPTDEPAGVLLECIQAERAAVPNRREPGLRNGHGFAETLVQQQTATATAPVQPISVQQGRLWESDCL
ncbi:MAG: restriction endonuclease subunit S [Ktedonobacterales bacterium]